MQDGIDSFHILASEPVSQGLLVTFNDRKTFIFERDALFANRESLGHQVTSATEEDEDDPSEAKPF
jgi:hypothetical protein